VKIIWITSLFPTGKETTKGIYLYRTVKKLSEKFDVITVVIYPSLPPFLQMLEKPKDAIKTYKYWKKNFPSNPKPPEGIQSSAIYYIRYWRLPRRFFNHLEGYFAYSKAKKIFRKIITKDTIIHSNWIFPSGQLAHILNKKYGIPYIVSLLGTDVHNLKFGTKYWEKANEVLQNASIISSVSKQLVEKCKKEKINLSNKTVFYLDNIYDETKFLIKPKSLVREKLNFQLNSKIIFFAGGLVPVKNVATLVKAFARLNTSFNNAKLLLAGAGIDKGMLQQLTHKFSCNSDVIFLGNLPSENLINYYNASDVFCLPSKNEGTPNVIVESLLCGTPVVASNVGGIPDVIQNEKNGYLFNPTDVDELERMLIKALSKKWEREEIRKSVSSFFTSETIIKYSNIYKQLSDKNI